SINHCQSGPPLRNSRKRPSEDQSSGALGRSDSSRSSSAPALLDNLQYRLKMPFRLDPNTMRLPLGDQSGKASVAASKVKRVGTPRAASMSQTSRLLLTVRVTATRFPSGDSSMSVKAAVSG